MIEALGVCRHYGSGAQSVKAVSNLNFSVRNGERLAVVGKSGSGKSTLLNLLAGLDQPTAGSLTIADRRLDQLSRNEMAHFRLRTVGVIFQAFQLIPQRTAIQNVELPMILNGTTLSDRRERARQLLQQVGLEQRADHYPYQLSGGEQQRVAIARALVNSPRLVLADEPTGNLDSATASKILDLLDELFHKIGTTIVFVTHDEQVAARMGLRQFRMSDGALSEIPLVGTAS